MSVGHILLVDNDVETVDYCCDCLKHAGYDFSLAKEGQEGLDILGKEHPNLVIFDIATSKMDELEFYRRLRKYSEVPIIMLSNQNDESERIKCIDIGADDYITKPFNKEEFIARIRSVIRRSENERIVIGDNGNGNPAGVTESTDHQDTDNQEATMHKKRELLGETLIRLGLATREQVDDALQKSKTENRLLGQVLVDQEILTTHDLARALSIQLNVELIDLPKHEIDSASIKLVPEKLARKHNVIPMNLKGDSLVLIMEDIHNIHAIQEISFVTHRQIEPVLGIPEEICKAIDRYYLSDLQKSELQEVIPTLEAPVVETKINGEMMSIPEAPVADTTVDELKSSTYDYEVCEILSMHIQNNTLQQEAQQGDNVGDIDNSPNSKESSDTEDYSKQEAKLLKNRDLLGETVLRLGLVKEEQLEDALRTCKSENKLLGQVLVEQGILTKNDLANVLSIQQSELPIDLMKHRISMDIIKLVPEKLARKYNVIPLNLVGDSLMLVMEDTRNIDAIEEISLAIHKRIEPMSGFAQQIHRAIDLNYAKNTKETELTCSDHTPEASAVNPETAQEINFTSEVLIDESTIDEELVLTPYETSEVPPTNTPKNIFLETVQQNDILETKKESSAEFQAFADIKDASNQETTMHRKGELLGETLIRLGLATREQVDDALQKSKTENRLLGQVLVEQEILTTHDLARALSIQLNVALIDLPKYKIDSEAMKLVPEKLARKYNVFPLAIKDNSLVLVMEDIRNIHAVQEVSFVTHRQIKPVLGFPEEICKAIDRYYSLDIQENELTDVIVSQSTIEDESTLTPDTEDSEVPAIRILNRILKQAAQRNVSDIHIEPQKNRIAIRFRIDGILQERESLPRVLHPALMSRLKIVSGLNIAETRRSQDGRFGFNVNGNDYDVRVACGNTIHGEMAVLRLLSKLGSLAELSGLGFMPDMLTMYERLLTLPAGMILLGGPTGSGKTTTLYASINILNRVERNIMTIEDPVEYDREGINQFQVNTKAGVTFSTGLRSFMRLDPDIIMIGEIRDSETAQIASQAALTGHLVLSSIHANDAVGVTYRMLDLGLESYMLCSTLASAISQRLVRRICPNCKEKYTPSVEERAVYKLYMGDQNDELYHGAGCNMCEETGYLGRIGIYEILTLSNNLKELILNGSPASKIEEKALEEGFVCLMKDGMMKVKNGLTTISEIVRNVYH